MDSIYAARWIGEDRLLLLVGLVLSQDGMYSSHSVDNEYSAKSFFDRKLPEGLVFDRDESLWGVRFNTRARQSYLTPGC